MFEHVIFSNLILNEEYGRKTIPFLKDDYFSDHTDKVLFNLISCYVEKYAAFPSKEALAIDLSNSSKISDDQFDDMKTVIANLEIDEKTSIDWLFDQTEKFCQDKAIYNAIHQSIQILNDKETAKLTKDAIPEILQQALAVSFDTNIGHDFLEDFDKRFEFYHRVEERIPFDIEYLNKITKGGLPRKSLSVLLGGTGVFKTGAMCHFAATNLMDGKNVLYITLEMAEERIAERIDANLLDIPLDDMPTIPKDMYDKKVARIQGKTQGKLIIKEYPTSTAGASHFRYLLQELKIKKNFKPDIIYIDYINICCSSRLKMGNNVNSYTYVKAIAEELRGLAVEFNVPVVTGTQLTRSGADSSDPTLQDTSECIYVNENVQLKTGEIKLIGDILVGDQITTNDGYKTVMVVHHKKMKECVRIRLKSGKSIIVSKDHVFPCSMNGKIQRLSVNDGLQNNCKLNTK